MYLGQLLVHQYPAQHAWLLVLHLHTPSATMCLIWDCQASELFFCCTNLQYLRSGYAYSPACSGWLSMPLSAVGKS